MKGAPGEDTKDTLFPVDESARSSNKRLVSTKGVRVVGGITDFPSQITSSNPSLFNSSTVQCSYGFNACKGFPVNPVDTTGKSTGGFNAVLSPSGAGHDLTRGSRLVGGCAARRFFLRSLVAALSFSLFLCLRLRLRSPGTIVVLGRRHEAVDITRGRDVVSLDAAEDPMGDRSILDRTGDDRGELEALERGDEDGDRESGWSRALARAVGNEKLLHSRALTRCENSLPHTAWKRVSSNRRRQVSSTSTYKTRCL